MSKPPALFNYAQLFYSTLREHSTKDTDGKDIFTGKTVETAKELGIAGPMYANVIRALTAMGCIERRQLGNKHQPSIIELFFEPKIEDFVTLDFDLLPTQQALTSEISRMRQDIRNLKLSIGDVNVQEALVGLSKSIKTLERKVNGGDV